MAYNSTNEYLKLLNELGAYHVPKNILHSLSGYAKPIYQSDIENRFVAPMLWIGLYIAFASLVCILAMVADIVHGLRSKKLWFPCKYFGIDSFSLTVIGVAMKLPVDLTGSMPGLVDQVAKIGSMAFMCTIMANLLPFLATMDDNDLYSNMAALAVLVITMVVNVCIQIKTGVVSTSTYNEDPRITTLVSAKHNVLSLPKIYSKLPIIYVTLLLMLLILYVSSFLALLTSKKKIEFAYQRAHDKASREIKESSERFLAVEKLQGYVRNHWIIARTSSSQFVFTTCFETTCASGVICVFVAILHILTMFWTFEAIKAKDYDSDYSWAMIVIVILQFIGVVIGIIAPLCRCFTPILTFVPGPHDVLLTESYWIEKLYDWRVSSKGLPSHLWRVIHTLKRPFFCFFMKFQQIVVAACKIIFASLHFVSFCVMCVLIRLKRLLKGVCSSCDGERTNNMNQEEISLSQEENFSIHPNVVRLRTDHYLNDNTRVGLLKSVKQLFQEGEKNQPNIDLLEKSTLGFYGVGKLKCIVFSRLFQNCWSLQVVTLATVACSLPEIEKKEVERLLRSVKECLAYVMLVDESFKDFNHYILKAVKVLLKEVHFNHEWLGNKLPVLSSQLNTARQVVEWLRDTSKNTRSGARNVTTEVVDENQRQTFKLSMQATSECILDRHNWDGDDLLASQQKLFDRLSSIIADTIFASLTNLPQIIINKCNPSVVEQREAGVKHAALLLGGTKHIIEKLRQHDIPNIDPSDMPFLSQWLLRRDIP